MVTTTSLTPVEIGAAGRPSFYQLRVALLGRVLTIVWLVGNLSSALFYFVMGHWDGYFTVGNALLWSALGICFSVWMICSRGVLPIQAVRFVESASMMGSTIAISLMGRHLAPQALSINAEVSGADLERLDPTADALLAGLQFEQILVSIMLG